MADTAEFLPRSLDDILTWLAGMDSLTRAQVARVLVDEGTVEALGVVRRGAVWELSRELGGRGAAEALGVSEAAVRKAIRVHNATINQAVSR